ncbi:putative GTPase (dynamin-related) protein [Oleiphilus messinensis]|uniref:Putative GTPase (Dynamin-related) protein n=1 Tax=Oleiphilus messinensis TaxID=141451 RepID=A0A1Y0I670_9GAMM|nr:dynamin family protein [Oleiphilus messinensis]ARU55035.1 putative GTPase (dynamin-related) protein [Oleiphilus messinensis]
MSKSSLTTHVEAYQKWKNLLITEIARYQNWLQANGLFSDDISTRLKRGFQLLREDELTIAFVGEYSRGKTELINALFFSGFGQRMLPSQAGRTTMCPTELFYDRKQNRNYIQLLPIETRASEATLANLKKQPERWHTIDLSLDSPQSMRAALDQVAHTKTVTVAEARALGFHDSMLDHDHKQPGRVIIPAWRHALISLKDPLLEQGLRILDTPGLNALGSEPELTVSMLPSAHAILFLLSADTGVTASDMTIWKEFIDTENADHRAGRFAVLNKIDVLWDDLQGDEYTAKSIKNVRTYTAEHLGMIADDVIPVSAKQGLIAKVKSDNALLARSALPELEHLISQKILEQKERLITQTLVNDLLGMLQNSEAILNSRLEFMAEQHQSSLEKGVSKEIITSLTEKTQTDYDFYYKKLITLRSSRRLMKSQGDILSELVCAERFESHLEKTKEMLQSSWTTIGMNRAMTGLFDLIEHDFANLMSEVSLADKMVSSIYKRYTEDTRAKHLHPVPFNIRRAMRDFRQLKNKAEQFRRNPKTIMTEQTLVIKRFFNTLVSELRNIYDRVNKEAVRWPEEALLPIMQYSLEQKQLLEHQIRRLKGLTENNRNMAAERERLRLLIQETREQLQTVESIHRVFRKPAPTLSTKKVVSITGKIA